MHTNKHTRLHFLPVTKSNACNECSALSLCSYVLSVCLLRLVNPLPTLQLACCLVFPSGWVRCMCWNPKHHLSAVLHFLLSSLTSLTNKVDLTVADYSNKGSPREYALSHRTSNYIKGRRVGAMRWRPSLLLRQMVTYTEGAFKNKPVDQTVADVSLTHTMKKDDQGKLGAQIE